MMLGKRRRQTVPSLPKKRKKSNAAIEVISFDQSAREDYLTGFHKRKLQRAKHAQEEAAKREKEERIAARKIMRDTRKVDLEKQVEAVNALIKKAEDELSENGEDESKVEQGGGVDVPGIIDEEAEYIDEDRHTTVTIEAVDVTRDGLRKVVDEDVESVGEENSHATEDVEMKDGKAAADGTGKRAWTKERPGGPKKKKPKFRYESKGDRKITRYKERSGNKAKAKARSSEAETRAGGGKAQAMARKNKRKK